MGLGGVRASAWPVALPFLLFVGMGGAARAWAHRGYPDAVIGYIKNRVTNGEPSSTGEVKGVTVED
jgi:hypothetical protein